MAHWAELDKNNVVLRVLVGDNNEPDEGYQWLLDNLGGRWVKTSFNTLNGKHLQGGVALRGNFAGPGFTYHEDIDAFMPPSPYPSWIIKPDTFEWIAPVPQPDTGLWKWDEETTSWIEFTPSESLQI